MMAGKSQKVHLKAGMLDMIYLDGTLRYIRSGNIEIVRMIYPALRDCDWLNIEGIRSNEIIEAEAYSFKITYYIRYNRDETDLAAKVEIRGTPDNSIIYRFEAEALNSFMKNRVGLCVLHPIEECAGNPCTIIHPDNTFKVSDFPFHISPHQPFTNIRSMKWRAGDHECTADFDGDIFETEDQRNWTDASYKTYSTPLSLPFPATVNIGERFTQRIKLRVEGDFPVEQEDGSLIKLSADAGNTIPVPHIGIGRSTRPEPLTDNEAGILCKVPFDHYRIDLHLFKSGWKKEGDLAFREADKLGYPAELALFFDDDAVKQITELIDWLQDKHTEIALFILYHKETPATPDEYTDALSPLLKNFFPGVRIASGTNANFAQLNRNRPASAWNDDICFSIHPQEHASDNLTLVENLKAQEYAVKSAGSFARGKGIRISPVNIRRRFNANIEYYERQSEISGFPAQIDPRIASSFGAAWSAGSMKYLFEAGIVGVTFFETVGERGIIQGDYPSKWPDQFPAQQGMIFPVFHLFRFILENKNYQVVKSTSSSPSSIDLLVLKKHNIIKAIIMNFTPEVQYAGQGFCRDLLIISQSDADPLHETSSDSEPLNKKTPMMEDSVLHLKPLSITFIEGRLR
jgi:hypothetical protein